MKFDPLFVTPQWLKEYHTKYPHGMSVLENIIEWVYRTNELIDWANVTPEKTELILNEWYTSGKLENIIINALERQVTVKDFGAVGDGVTDDSAAFQDALDTLTHVIVPEGVYRVKNVSLSSFTSKTLEGQNGAVIVPFKRFSTANMPDQVLNIGNGEKFTLKNIEFRDSVTNTLAATPAYYTKALVRFENVVQVVIDGCYVHGLKADVTPSYMTAFEDRDGLFLTTQDCNLTFINNKIENMYGEEFIFNHYRLGGFTDYVHLYENNVFGESNPVNGSIINHIGGHLIFRNNLTKNYNYNGSAYNFLNDVVEIIGNITENCEVRIMYDNTESGYAKGSSLIMTGEIMDSPKVRRVLTVNVADLIIKNNHMICYSPVYANIFTTNPDVVYSNPATKDIYNDYTIEGNVFHKKENLTADPSFLFAGIHIELRNATSSNYAMIKKIEIRGNSFKSDAIGQTSVALRLLAIFKNIIIKDNVFEYAGKYQGSVQNGYLQKTGNSDAAIGIEEKIHITGNTFLNLNEATTVSNLMNSNNQSAVLKADFVNNINLATGTSIPLYTATNLTPGISANNTNFNPII